MAEFYGNLEKMTTTNTDYRKVLGTTDGMQLVVMRLKPLEEIGSEVHPTTTQFIRIESGRGRCIIDGKQYILDDDDAVIIPPNKQHNLINISDTDDLMFYTIYSPPVHAAGCVQKKKEDDEC